MNLKAWEVLSSGSEPDGVNCITVSHEYGHGNAQELETALFIYGLLRREKPILCLESGTHWGFSSAVMALALKDNAACYPHLQYGHLLTIDVNDYDHRGEKLWEKIGVRDFITRFVGSSEDPALASHLGQQLPTPLSFVFFDADHAAEALWAEYNNYLPYMDKKRCIWGTHDGVLDRRLRPGIQLCVEDMKKRKIWKHVEQLSFLNLRGLDFVLLSNEDF